ncbi:MAG: NMD3-related protein [Pyrobaculum sp.]
MAKIPCPHCGSLVDRLIEGMCEKCYIEKHPLVSIQEKVVTKCKYCGAVYLKGKWIKYKELDKLYRKILYEKGKVVGELKSIEVEEDENFTTLRIFIEGSPHSEIPPSVYSYNIEIYFKFDICTNCRELLTKKETALIQIRSTPRVLDKEILKKVLFLIQQEVFKWKDKKVAITEVKELKHGVDIYTTSPSFARHLAYVIHNSFPSYIIESAKAVGSRDGRRIYHLTYSIRLLTYRPGDVVKIRGVEKVILEINNRFISLQDIQTKNFEQITISEFLNSNVLFMSKD